MRLVNSRISQRITVSHASTTASMPSNGTRETSNLYSRSTSDTEVMHVRFRAALMPNHVHARSSFTIRHVLSVLAMFSSPSTRRGNYKIFRESGGETRHLFNVCERAAPSLVSLCTLSSLNNEEGGCSIRFPIRKTPFLENLFFSERINLIGQRRMDLKDLEKKRYEIFTCCVHRERKFKHVG